MSARQVLAALLLFAAAACSYPSSRVDVPDERPSIAFRGAPSGAEVFVDNVAMGPAGRFDGDPSVLLVEQGTHLIEVRLKDQTLFSQRVFMSGRATRTFNIR